MKFRSDLNKAISENYDALRRKARHITRSEEKGDELLHHTIAILYESGREIDTPVNWIQANMILQFTQKNSAWNKIHRPTKELPTDIVAPDEDDAHPEWSARSLECLSESERMILQSYISGVDNPNARNHNDSYLRVNIHRIKKKLKSYESTGKCSTAAVIYL